MDSNKPEAGATAVIVAGPNGAGKSTFIERYCRTRYPGIDYICADVIEREHRTRGIKMEDYDATKEAERQRNEAIAQGRSFIAETVFSDPNKLQLIEALRDAGYTIDLHLIQLDSDDLAVARVQQRVADGGHPVREEKIRSRFPKTRQLTAKAEAFATRTWVWDNSDATRPFRKVRGP